MQWFFQESNKSYFISSNNTETYYGMQLFANWMRQNHEKVLEKRLRDEGSERKKRLGLSFYIFWSLSVINSN